MQRNPDICNLGCGEGVETVKMDQGQNGKDLEFNPKDIWMYGQLGEMKFLKKKIMNEHWSILTEVKAPKQMLGYSYRT